MPFKINNTPCIIRFSIAVFVLVANIAEQNKIVTIPSKIT